MSYSVLHILSVQKVRIAKYLLNFKNVFLKKVDKRPKITQKDDENENITDREAAKKSWNIHLSINNSIIVDLFQVNFECAKRLDFLDLK